MASKAWSIRPGSLPDQADEQGQGMVTQWPDQFGAALAGTSADDASATLVIAVLRGLP